MKVALAQMDLEIGAFRDNVSRMAEMARRAEDDGCALVLFPELAVCGYPPRDLLKRADFVAASADGALELASRIGEVTAVFGGVEPSVDGRVFNAAYVARAGRVVAVYRKMLLPAYDIFDEPRYFSPGDAPCWLDLPGARAGLTICEDIWNGEGLSGSYARDPVEELGQADVSLLLNVSASPYEFGKAVRRREWLARTAVSLGAPVAYCNMVGGHDSIVFDGGSMVMDRDGTIVAEAPYFEEALLVADIGDRGHASHPVLEEMEMLSRALVLGLRDYLRRTGFRRVLLGLSGGIDSSVCAVLASRAVGPENVLGVLMPSPYTSRESIEDALELASRLGIATMTVEIGPVMEAFSAQLAPSFEGYPRDVTEENLQARIRGTILMSLSNKFHSLLLATGNKSELAVGYCTMYGDMAGGFAPIADLFKTRVYALAEHLNQAEGAIPERVFEKPPSAELRPGQTDQDDLPPYPVLDRILEGYLEHGLTEVEIAAQEGIDQALVSEMVARLHRNEYKRHQAPPGIRVSRAAFSDGRRFPICHRFGG